MKKKYGVLTVLLGAGLTFFAGSASALTFNTFDIANVAGINGWIAAQGGATTIIEDFNDEAMGWYTSYATDVGTFVAGGLPGTGATAYPGPDPGPHFSINNTQYPGPYGRGNLFSKPGLYLDSGDISEVTLNIEPGLNLQNLFFYLMDPSDVSANTTVTTGTGEFITFNYKLANANATFIGITLGLGETLDSLVWSTGSKDNDGWGVDYFGTAHAPVPEPATMLLFGAGLAGLAGARRRMKK